MQYLTTVLEWVLKDIVCSAGFIDSLMCRHLFGSTSIQSAKLVYSVFVARAH